jgi:hypothetical protein
MQKKRIQFLTLTAIILAAAFSRIVPHMPNFSPMDAVTLFAAAYFARIWQVFLIPFAAMWLSSLFIDNVIYAAYNPQFVWMYPGFHWQYLSYFLIALLGLGVFRNGVSSVKIIAGSLGGGAIFFLVSNAGVWVQQDLYPHNFSGLITCYTAAIPFYRGTLLGDVFYTTVLFGGFALLRLRFPACGQAH